MIPIPTENLKIKVFGTNASNKELKAQEWFDSNPDIEILDIQYSGRGAGQNETSGFALIYHYRIIEDGVLP